VGHGQVHHMVPGIDLGFTADTQGVGHHERFALGSDPKARVSGSSHVLIERPSLRIRDACADDRKSCRT
jgi:hypothetical protein